MPQSPNPNRRAFLSSLMAAPLLTAACRKDYGRFFDIEWDEEVELHNGRIIIVHVKRTFERVKHMRYSQWKGMRESTEISFNAGGKIGDYKKKFDGYDIRSINHNKGNWYITLIGLDRALRKYHEIVQQMIPVWIVNSDTSERAARSWSEVPFFPKLNMLPVTPDSEGISKFNDTLLTIQAKKMHWAKFPSGPKGDGTLKNINNQQPLPEL